MANDKTFVVHTSQYEQKGIKLWKYRFEFPPTISYDSNGKEKTNRHWKNKKGFATKAEALQDAQAEIDNYKETGQTRVTAKQEMTFESLCNIWLEYQRSHVKSRTYDVAVFDVNILVPLFGKYQINKVTRYDCQTLVDRLATLQNDKGEKRFSTSTLKRITTNFKSIFRFAVTMGFIFANPCEMVTKPATDEVIDCKEEFILEPAQFDLLMERFPEGTRYHLPIVLAYRLGLRLGEVLGLCWEQVDFINKQVTVLQQLQYDKINHDDTFHYFTRPKRNKTRIIDVDDKTMALLERERERQSLYKNEFGIDYVQYFEKNFADNRKDTKRRIYEGKTDNPINFVCRLPSGAFMKNTCSHSICKIVHTELGITRFKFHGLRAAHASRCAEAGLAMKYVSERLGHGDIHITAKYYVKVSEKMRKTESEKLNQMF